MMGYEIHYSYREKEENGDWSEELKTKTQKVGLGVNNYMRLFIIFTTILLFVGCNQNLPTVHQTGFPYNKYSKNIAALFTMTNESGRKENLRMMESIFEDGKLGFEYQSHHDKPSKYIYDTLTQLAKDVGEYGTLLIYVNSHGGGSGDRFGMTSSDGSFKFSKALEAIAKGNKVRRLIVLIDTCHASGGIQEAFQGQEQPIPNTKTGLPELPDVYYGTPEAYHEVLILASCSAQDLSSRGAFASRLQKAYRAIQEEDLTVAEFLKEFAALHSNINQKPYYKVMPNESILEEPLFSNAIIRDIPIIDHQNNRRYLPNEYPPGYIPWH